MIPPHLFVASLFGWLQREQHEIIRYMREENRVLKAQLRNQRLRFTNDDRRRLAALGASLGRRILAQVATIVTPDTILRWHRQLIARKWTHSKRRPGRPSALPEIRRLVVLMATENPRWGYTRIQGALKNLNHSARERYQFLARNRRGHNMYGIFRDHWLLLAASHLTPAVRVDAPTDLGAARANRLTDVRYRRPRAKRGRKVGELSARMSGASCRASQFRAAGRGVSMRDRYGGESGPERALFVVGCDRSTVVKSEMSV